MGWQERDYASEPVGGHVDAFGQRGRGGIWSGSIVKKLLIANIVIHVLGTFPAFRTYIYGYGVMQGAAVLRGGEIWRLLTATYLHAGLTHIFLNMLGLYFFGPPLERVWGSRRFLVIYTLCGLLGNVALSVACLLRWLPMDVPALGASGCILGLLGAAAVLFPRADVYVYFLFPVKIRTVAIVLGVAYLLNIRIQGGNYGGYICHLSGLVFGAWWAWKGERWWATRQSASRSRQTWTPKRKVWPGVGKGAWGRKVERHAADEEEVDRILAKVREGGINTLTQQEKKTLLDATERLRRDEAHAGRVDRL